MNGVRVFLPLLALVISCSARGADTGELAVAEQENVNRHLNQMAVGLAPTNCELDTTGRPRVGSCAKRVPAELPKVRFRPGDVVFISSSSSQSDMLEVATRSTWTHVGLIVMRGAQPFVLEASSKVTLTPLAQFVAKSRGRQISVKRPNPGSCSKCDLFSDAAPPAELQKRITAASSVFLGKPYDVRFEWGDDKMYCSELVEKVYNRAFDVKLGRVQTFGEVLGIESGAKDPGKSLPPLVREAIEKRYGGIGNLDLNAPMVTPVAQHESPVLKTVYECRENSPVPLSGGGRSSE